jgi:hypothetical protein
MSGMARWLVDRLLWASFLRRLCWGIIAGESGQGRWLSPPSKCVPLLVTRGVDCILKRFIFDVYLSASSSCATIISNYFVIYIACISCKKKCWTSLSCCFLMFSPVEVLTCPKNPKQPTLSFFSHFTTGTWNNWSSSALFTLHFYFQQRYVQLFVLKRQGIWICYLSLVIFFGTNMLRQAVNHTSEVPCLLPFCQKSHTFCWKAWLLASFIINVCWNLKNKLFQEKEGYYYSTE